MHAHVLQGGILMAAVVVILILMHASKQVAVTPHSNAELIIVTAHYNEDLAWLKHQHEFPVVVCDKVGAGAIPFSPDSKCSLKVNRGREASSFLKFIIEYYDDLPRHIAFVHGHEFADHQKLPFGIIEGIRRAKKHDFDYISLNARAHYNHLHNTSTARSDSNANNVVDASHWFSHPGHHFLRRHWDSHFAGILGGDFPEHLGYMCCAQFVVSRRAIRRHPKEAYMRLYELVMDQTKGTDYEAAVAIEFIWHILFGEKPDRWSAGTYRNESSSTAYVASRFE